jgi:hypothetical protein
MLQRFAVRLARARHTIAAAVRGRRRDDTGALTTLETVVLAVGFVAIAALFVAAANQFVNVRLDQLR